MDKIKRFIGVGVPVYSCNFRCSYCYLAQHSNAYNGRICKMEIEPEVFAECLSPERMGGICYFNFCAAGETMFMPDLYAYIKSLINKGHYCDIITNLSISKKVDELISFFNEEERKHLFIKCSFHYLELKRLNLLDLYIANINKLKNARISYTIEITPCDELVPYIDEIKEFSLKKFGSLPHISVARNEGVREIELLTEYSREEFKIIWSSFNSVFFDFKFSIFNRPIKEFCYAGQNSIYLNMLTGEYKQCYCGDILGNAYNLKKKMNFRPIGKCRLAHCFNGHSFIAWAGNVPDIDLPVPTFAEERNRVCSDGSEWLQPEIKTFFESRADKQNKIYSESEKKSQLQKNKFYKIINIFIRIKNKMIYHRNI